VYRIVGGSVSFSSSGVHLQNEQYYINVRDTGRMKFSEIKYPDVENKMLLGRVELYNWDQGVWDIERNDDPRHSL
jgi:hypothetical protein